MQQSRQRIIVHWIHLVFSIPILGYIYSPFDQLPLYSDRVRFVFVPVVVLSGLWMWKGHAVRGVFANRSTQQASASRRGGR